jgi:hypothetical protein
MAKEMQFHMRVADRHKDMLPVLLQLVAGHLQVIERQRVTGSPAPTSFEALFALVSRGSAAYAEDKRRGTQDNSGPIARPRGLK